MPQFILAFLLATHMTCFCCHFLHEKIEDTKESNNLSSWEELFSTAYHLQLSHSTVVMHLPRKQKVVGSNPTGRADFSFYLSF